jgi:virulence-associated protein VapD
LRQIAENLKQNQKLQDQKIEIILKNSKNFKDYSEKLEDLSSKFEMLDFSNMNPSVHIRKEKKEDEDEEIMKMLKTKKN